MVSAEAHSGARSCKWLAWQRLGAIGACLVGVGCVVALEYLAFGVLVAICGLLLTGAASALAAVCAKRSPRRAAGLLGAALLLAATAIVFMAYERVPRVRLRAIAQADLTVLGRLLFTYYERHGEFPVVLRALVDEGIANEHHLWPRMQFELSDGDAAGYAYVSGLTRADPAGWLLAFDRAGVHDDGTRTVLYLSGAVSTLSEQEFAGAFKRFSREFTAVRGHAPKIAWGH